MLQEYYYKESISQLVDRVLIECQNFEQFELAPGMDEDDGLA